MRGRTPESDGWSLRNRISRTNRWYDSFSTLVVLMSFRATGDGALARLARTYGDLSGSFLP